MKRKAWVLATAFISIVLVAAAAVWILSLKRRQIGMREPPEFQFSIDSDDLKSRLGAPSGVIVGRGRVYVADSKNKRIQVFNEQGKPVSSFYTSRTPRKRPKRAYPFCLAMDNSGRLYITDLALRKVLVFRLNGSYLYGFPLKNWKTLKKPTAVTFFNQNLYFADAGDHKVKKYALDGKLLDRFGELGTDPGKFSFPNGLALSSDGSIYVSDSNNKRVQVFTGQGKFKKVIGKGKLVLPRGIAIDELDRLHVADSFGHQIVVFDKDGEELFSYTRELERKGDIFPEGIWVDNRSRKIYVTDRINSSVLVWGYPED